MSLRNYSLTHSLTHWGPTRRNKKAKLMTNHWLDIDRQTERERPGGAWRLTRRVWRVERTAVRRGRRAMVEQPGRAPGMTRSPPHPSHHAAAAVHTGTYIQTRRHITDTTTVRHLQRPQLTRKLSKQFCWAKQLFWEPQNWGRGGRRGRGWYPSKERWWVPTGHPW